MVLKDHLDRKYTLLNVKLVAFMDLDGTLTDGTLLYNGKTIGRKYFTQDSHAMNYALANGIFPIIVTNSPITADIEQRCEWLNTPIFTAYKTRKILVPEIAELIANFDTAHIGDDLNDVEMLCCVDYSFIPANSNPQLDLALKTKDDIIKLSSFGGSGAVRDYLFTLIDILSVQE